MRGLIWQATNKNKDNPLTLALSPLKKGERGQNKNKESSLEDRSRKNRGTEPAYAEAFRRELREALTKAEGLVWAMVRNRRLEGYKFRRQHSIGSYIVDFVCLEERLIVELDGGYHDFIIEKDLTRDVCLKDLGFHVLRFTNDDVVNDAESIARAILNVLKEINEKKSE